MRQGIKIILFFLDFFKNPLRKLYTFGDSDAVGLAGDVGVTSAGLCMVECLSPAIWVG